MTTLDRIMLIKDWAERGLTDKSLNEKQKEILFKGILTEAKALLKETTS